MEGKDIYKILSVSFDIRTLDCSFELEEVWLQWRLPRGETKTLRGVALSFLLYTMEWLWVHWLMRQGPEVVEIFFLMGDFRNSGAQAVVFPEPRSPEEDTGWKRGKSLSIVWWLWSWRHEGVPWRVWSCWTLTVTGWMWWAVAEGSSKYLWRQLVQERKAWHFFVGALADISVP